MNEEKTKIKMDDDVARFSLASKGICLFVDLWTCGRHSLVSETQNEIVVS